MFTAAETDLLQRMAASLKAAQERTGDSCLAHSVKQGKFDLQRVTFDAKGRGKVERLGEYLPPEEHIARLDALVKGA
jgi:hypothetical protein